VETKNRGVYEKVRGSGVWWIRYFDAVGKLRREKVGSKSAAIKLRDKRKTDAWEGKKLPRKLRVRAIRFSELADDYLKHSAANNLGKDVDKYRIEKLKVAFGRLLADVPIADLREWFAGQEWAPGTYNRCRTVLGLIFKLGIENGKIESNPARLLKRRKEPDGRVRFLNQHRPRSWKLGRRSWGMRSDICQSLRSRSIQACVAVNSTAGLIGHASISYAGTCSCRKARTVQAGIFH
jgi:hypothetical protein